MQHMEEHLPYCSEILNLPISQAQERPLCQMDLEYSSVCEENANQDRDIHIPDPYNTEALQTELNQGTDPLSSGGMQNFYDAFDSKLCHALIPSPGYFDRLEYSKIKSDF